MPVNPALETLPLDSPPPAPPPVRPIGGRYRLGRVIGRGGQAVVHEAEDTTTGARVAIKLYRGAQVHPDMVRRERAVLRWLRLPGIVRLLDDGDTPQGSYVVTELVDGAPFLDPGSGRRPAWEEIREPLLELLGVLGWVHAAGLLHRDLKPANVILRPDGRPVLLDFGTVQDVTVADQTTKGWATEAYAAPEQLATGRCDARTDLYALGVMVYTALSGAPVREISAGRLRAGTLPPPAPSILSLVPTLPPRVAATIDRMVAPSPDDRPASAAEVADGFREGAPRWLPPRCPTERVVEAAALTPLFGGHSRFHHLPEDAAALLFEVSGGAPERVAQTLRAWLDTGWVRRDGELLVTDRAALERIRCLRALEEGDPDGRPFAPNAAPEGLADRCLALGRRLREEGRAASAASLFALGLGAARRVGDAPRETAAAVALAEAALVQESPAAADGAIAEIERAPLLEDALRPIAGLLRIARITRGPFEPVLAALDAVPRFAEEELEVWRQGLRATTARRVGNEVAERVLEGMADWAASTPTRSARLDGWWGNVRYRQLRFVEAAELHLRSAAGKRLQDGRISALYNASQALLDAGDLERAQAVAERVVVEAVAVRRAEFEARGALVLRNAQYRRALDLAPDPAVVVDAAPLGPYVEGAFALVEASIAWRRGEPELARRLADHATARFTAGTVPEAALLSRGLGWLCSARGAADADTLVADARVCGLVGIVAQVRGLLAMGGMIAHELDDACVRWMAERGAAARDTRAEVLAPAECLPKMP